MKSVAKLALSSSLLALIVAGAIAGCGSDGGSNTTGKAGTTGTAGTGAAGTTGGSGTTGSSGTTGTAGTGAAGTGAAGTGAAGTGAAGTGAAGTGAAGTGAAGTGAAGTGAAGTGAAGTGAAGTGAAGTGAAGTGGAGKMAVATLAPLGTNTVKGTATFTQMGTDTLLKVDLTECPEGVHPLHIHLGTGCASAAEQGGHWDSPRGEMIGPGTITCLADKTGTLTYTRMGTMANLKWTVGDGSATDPVGHPFMIHAVGAAATDRVACGVITLKP